MARLFGFIGNRADLGARVLLAHREVLQERRPAGGPLGWGIGFYQSGEVLLRRRPIDDREVLDLAEAAEDVRTDVLIGQVRVASVGALRTENTHPFRHRNWLFAHIGTLGEFERTRVRLSESLPEFLRRNVRGETDSELLFYLVLSFLHDAGRLGDDAVDPGAVREAVRSALSLVDRLSAEVGAPATESDLLITNGEHMVALHRRGVMATRVLSGPHDLEELLDAEGNLPPRAAPAAALHFTLAVAGVQSVPPRFTEVPRCSLVTLTRSEAPVVEPI